MFVKQSFEFRRVDIGDSFLQFVCQIFRKIPTRAIKKRRVHLLLLLLFSFNIIDGRWQFIAAVIRTIIAGTIIVSSSLASRQGVSVRDVAEFSRFRSSVVGWTEKLDENFDGALDVLGAIWGCSETRNIYMVQKT